MTYRLARNFAGRPDTYGTKLRRYEPVVECPECHAGEPFHVLGVRFGGYTCKCGGTFVAAKHEAETGDIIA